MTFLARYRWAVLVVVGAGLIAGAVITQRSNSRTKATVETRGGGTARVKGTLGPTPGPNADGYVADKRKFLDTVAAATPQSKAAGLVSLAHFMNGSDVAKLVGTSRVDLLFVRFPSREPAVVRVKGTVELAFGTRSQEIAAELSEEGRKLAELAKTASGDQRRQYLQQATDRQVSANAIRSGCACVFGLLVGGTNLGRLLALQHDAGVRLVDVPDPPQADLRGWELRPILPKS
jgi:hypothetical protein